MLPPCEYLNLYVYTTISMCIPQSLCEYHNVYVYTTISMCIQQSLCVSHTISIVWLKFQAAAHNVRLDGDVILQQSDVLHWQAEGAGSMEELRSVCSCACDSCLYNPFQKKAEGGSSSVNNLIEMNENGRASTTMRYQNDA